MVEEEGRNARSRKREDCGSPYGCRELLKSVYLRDAFNLENYLYSSSLGNLETSLTYTGIP